MLFISNFHSFQCFSMNSWSTSKTSLLKLSPLDDRKFHFFFFLLLSQLLSFPNNNSRGEMSQGEYHSCDLHSFSIPLSSLCLPHNLFPLLYITFISFACKYKTNIMSNVINPFCVCIWALSFISIHFILLSFYFHHLISE